MRWSPRCVGRMRDPKVPHELCGPSGIRVDDDVSVRESLELMILAAWLAPRDFPVGGGFPGKFAHRWSELSGARCVTARPRWSRSPEAPGRMDRYAHHLHHWLWGVPTSVQAMKAGYCRICDKAV